VCVCVCVCMCVVGGCGVCLQLRSCFIKDAVKLVLHTYIGVHWCAEWLLWTTMVNTSPFLETAPSLKAGPKICEVCN